LTKLCACASRSDLHCRVSFTTFSLITLVAVHCLMSTRAAWC